MKRFLALFLSVMIIISYFSFIPSIEVHAEDVKYIFIGDSRFVGMANAQGVSPTTTKNNGGNGTQTITQSGDVYWCAEVGTQISSFESEANKALKKGKKGSTIVIYGLGVNGLSNISKDVAYCEGLVDDGWTVYYCDLLPTTSSSSIKDADVVKANETIYKSKKYKVIKYHDSCDTKNCTDGIHYNSTGYKAWYSEIMKQASSGGSSGGTKEVSEEDKKKAEDTFKSSLGLSDEQLSVAKAMCAVLIADDFTAEATSGIVGNCFGECSFNSKAYAYDNSDKPNDVNGGLYGFTPIKDMVDSNGCWDGIKCNHEKFLYGDTKGSHKQQKACPDGGCQVAYMLKGVDAKFAWSGFYNKAWNSYIDDCKSKMKDADFFTKKLPENPTLAQLKAMTEWDSATVEFNICYEISYGNNILIKKNKAYHDTTSSSAACHKYSSNKLKGAKACYDYLKAVGTVTADGSTDGSNILSTDSDKQEAENMAYALAANGYWSESQLGEFNQVYETQVTIDGSRSDFTSKELGALSDWEQNVQKMNEKGSIFYYVRIITMIIGIIFTVWMLLIYIAYWFDRLNNIIDIDLLPILTFHRLRLSDTEETCTFRASDLAKTDTRTVNHRAILGICIVGVAFGALVISGTLYVAIMTLVQKVFNLLGIGG